MSKQFVVILNEEQATVLARCLRYGRAATSLTEEKTGCAANIRRVVDEIQSALTATSERVEAVNTKLVRKPIQARSKSEERRLAVCGIPHVPFKEEQS